MSSKAECPTCLAMADADFLRQTPEHAIELGHIAGMTIGLAIFGGHTVAEARERTEAMLCHEHAADLVRAAQSLSTTIGAAVRRRGIA
jgi:hypothetical protein